MEKGEERKIMMKAKNYCLIDNKLYRRALVEPLLKCVNQDEARTVMTEVHLGICGDHLAGKNMALKIIRHGVYWPTMRQDCENFTRCCEPYQKYGSVSHRPSVSFNPMTTLCPFYMWGIDLVGLLPKSSKQCKFIIVAVDYFTKWVESKPLAMIREIEAVNFFMEQIVFRFGVPRVVSTNNGSQFIGERWTNTMSELDIHHVKASVAYPQANGQVEITNKAILQGLKKRLLEASKTG